MILLFFLWALIIIFGLRPMVESNPVEGCIIIGSILVILVMFVMYIL